MCRAYLTVSTRCVLFWLTACYACLHLVQHATDFLHAILSLADRFMVPCFWPGYLSSASTILFCAMLFLAALFPSSFQVSGRLRVCGFFFTELPSLRSTGQSISCDYGVHVFQVALVKKFLVGDFSWPEDSVDFSEPGSVERSQPGHVIPCQTPVFWPIEKGGQLTALLLSWVWFLFYTEVTFMPPWSS